MNEHIRPPAAYEELPHNIDAEQGLLGAILVSERNSAFHAVSALVSAEHFYDELHGAIFTAIEATIRSGRTATPVTLKAQFEDYPPIENGRLTVPQYLGSLAVSATTVANAKDYARTVYDYFTRRRIISIAAEMITSAYSAPVDFPPLQQIDQAEMQLDALRLKERNEREAIVVADAMDEAIDLANLSRMSGAGLAGLSTGIVGLDAKTGGLAPSDMIILGGRPGMGKTALATTIAANVAKSGQSVGFFSLEMSRAQVAARILAGETGISSDTQRRGTFSEAEMRSLMTTRDTFRSGRVQLHIDDTGGLTLPQLATKARRLVRAKALGLIVVDYLQLMGATRRGNGSNRVQELTDITTGLKSLAKELNVPVLALSQLSRKVEERDDKRPQLSDLRESGSIEQDADVVMFCYRDEYYAEQEKPQADAKQVDIDAWEQRMDRSAGMAEVIIAKHRHGPVGSVELAFDGPRTLFTDRG
jgi:replicative DNA helicase